MTSFWYQPETGQCVIIIRLGTWDEKLEIVVTEIQLKIKMRMYGSADVTTGNAVIKL